MSVRAKFKVTRFETSMNSAWIKDETEKGGGHYEQREMRTITLHPVYSDDPTSENKKWWTATPSGEIKLGTVNPEAWKGFELEREFYIDFTPADGK